MSQNSRFSQRDDSDHYRNSSLFDIHGIVESPVQSGLPPISIDNSVQLSGAVKTEGNNPVINLAVSSIRLKRAGSGTPVDSKNEPLPRSPLPRSLSNSKGDKIATPTNHIAPSLQNQKPGENSNGQVIHCKHIHIHRLILNQAPPSTSEILAQQGKSSSPRANDVINLISQGLNNGEVGKFAPFEFNFNSDTAHRGTSRRNSGVNISDVVNTSAIETKFHREAEAEKTAMETELIKLRHHVSNLEDTITILSAKIADSSTSSVYKDGPGGKHEKFTPKNSDATESIDSQSELRRITALLESKTKEIEVLKKEKDVTVEEWKLKESSLLEQLRKSSDSEKKSLEKEIKITKQLKELEKKYNASIQLVSGLEASVNSLQDISDTHLAKSRCSSVESLDSAFPQVSPRIENRKSFNILSSQISPQTVDVTMSDINSSHVRTNSESISKSPLANAIQISPETPKTPISVNSRRASVGTTDVVAFNSPPKLNAKDSRASYGMIPAVPVVESVQLWESLASETPAKPAIEVKPNSDSKLKQSNDRGSFTAIMPSVVAKSKFKQSVLPKPTFKAPGKET